MLNKNRSVIITQCAVRVCYVLLALCVIGLPLIIEYGVKLNINIVSRFGAIVIIPFYLVVTAGYAALICIDKLLNNIKRSIIFDRKNVRLLGSISLCCFYAAAVGMISFAVIACAQYPYASFVVLACGELFMGLIVRVVTHIFEAAIEIKEENELTI